MEDERRDVRHGTLSYAPMRSVPGADIDALLDDEAIRQIVGPGAEPGELPWRMPPGEDLGPADGVHRHLILEDGRLVGMLTFTEEWRSVAIGFWLTASARGRGVLHGAWADLSPLYDTAIEAGCWRDNAAAARFLMSIGMRAGEEWCHDGRWAVHWEGGRPTVGEASGESGE